MPTIQLEDLQRPSRNKRSVFSIGEQWSEIKSTMGIRLPHTGQSRQNRSKFTLGYTVCPVSEEDGAWEQG